MKRPMSAIVPAFLSALLLAGAATPASAQIFWKPADYSGPAVTGMDETLGQPLPGATAEEQRAAIAWSVRSGLNVAALQCGFAPTLRTLENYNGMLRNHTAELASAFNTVSNYFKRVSKTPQLGQKALDTYGTKTYSGYSAVAAQLDFCQVAGRVGTGALFAPRGNFTAYALEKIRELRNGLVQKGEQQFHRPTPINVATPQLADKCWKKKKYSCG